MAAARTVFFCGIGGSGMSTLAQVLRHHGHAVRGSDRSWDNGQNRGLFDQLRSRRITLFPQDGSGVDDTVDELVVSAAVEKDIPDVRAALRRKIPVRKRAEVLAELFNPSATLSRAWLALVSATREVFVISSTLVKESGSLFFSHR